jgi:Nif-specific regulatory protein
MGFENVLIAIVEPDSNKLKLFGKSFVKKDISYKRGEGIIGKVWKHGIPIVIPNILEEKEFLNKFGRDLKKYKNKKVAFIAVPIKIENKIIGVLGVDKPYTGYESLDEYTKFLTMVSNILGQSVKLISNMKKEKEQLEKEKKYLKAQLNTLLSKTGLEGIVGRSQAIMEVVDNIYQVAPTNATVLLTGESGVGKELFAKAVHYNSSRASKPFIKLNCAAIPEDLLESELFGFEKGAFTGAYTTKKGKFEMADGGTIFLDEIGDMPISLQAKILRVLQEKEVERLGSSKPIKIDVRIIAATNKNLMEMVSQGTFREDLYYRLNVVPIFIPPLRERKEDIPVMVNYFVNRINKEYRKDVSISKELMDLLIEYDWPGNVRQLQNTIERMIILSKKDMLTIEDLPKDLKLEKYKFKNENKKIIDSNKAELPKTVEQIEKEAIIKALEESNYVIKNAAKLLGMTPRQIRYRMDKYGISVKH